jgi:hypothetical protein
MSGVVRKQASFDQDLAELGRIRAYRCDFVDTVTGLAPIYRETTITTTTTPDQFDRTPWWKRKIIKQRRPKP